MDDPGQIVDNKVIMGSSLKEANFSLAGVYYTAGDDIKYQVSLHIFGCDFAVS